MRENVRGYYDWSEQVRPVVVSTKYYRFKGQLNNTDPTDLADQPVLVHDKLVHVIHFGLAKVNNVDLMIWQTKTGWSLDPLYSPGPGLRAVLVQSISRIFSTNNLKMLINVQCTVTGSNVYFLLIQAFFIRRCIL